MKTAYLIGVASLALALGTPAAIAQTNGANGANAGAGVEAGAGGAAGTRGPGGALIAVSPSGVRQVQQALNRLGYFAGPVNGEWDKETADAMVHFQEAHGLEPTGNLNFSSIAGLGLWDNLIGNPLGNGNKALVANSTGVPGARKQEANRRRRTLALSAPDHHRRRRGRKQHDFARTGRNGRDCPGRRSARGRRSGRQRGRRGRRSRRRRERRRGQKAIAGKGQSGDCGGRSRPTRKEPIMTSDEHDQADHDQAGRQQVAAAGWSRAVGALAGRL